MLSIAEAQERIRSAVSALPVCDVSLDQSVGCVLAEDVASDRCLPAFDNSAMDGYAVRAADVSGASRERPVRLRVVEHIEAGRLPQQPIVSGTAARIFTGAPMPTGADAVVMQEDTDCGTEMVTVWDEVRPSENVRRAGEDVGTGEVVLRAGTRVAASHLALLAALGLGRVRVVRRPRVAVLATGDELVEAGQRLGPGQVGEGNSLMLAALVRELGAEVVRLGIARDERNELREKLVAGLRCDAIITSGGVSVGEHDLVRPVLEEMGCPLEFWRVAVKPGKPFGFGRSASALIFALPGNPGSALVTFLLFVRPAIWKLAGHGRVDLPRCRAVATSEFRNAGDRPHYMRGVLTGAAHGWEVATAGGQQSHMVGSLSRANCLVEVPAGGTVRPGQEVMVLPW